MGIKDKPSQIKNMRYHTEGKTWIDVPTSHLKVTEDTLGIEPQKIKLKSKEWVIVETKYQQTKQVNDVHFIVFTNATANPILTVKTSGGIAYRRGFTHENGEPEDGLLKGTLLPRHSVYVRWWPKGDK